MRELTVPNARRYIENDFIPTNGMQVSQIALGLYNRVARASISRDEKELEIQNGIAIKAERMSIPGLIYQDPFSQSSRGDDAIVVILADNENGWIIGEDEVFEDPTSVSGITEDNLIEMVERDPNAIGYISRDKLTSGVRELVITD